jgi:DNA polymerase III alpha subunit (gram-positive type)
MYLALDTETTGVLSIKHNLLTACFIVLNKNLHEIDRLNLSIKYNEYTVTIKALEINKIDLITHHYNSIDLASARSVLNEFLIKNEMDLLIPIGHNVSFDLNFVLDSGLLTKEEYDTFISKRIVDTLTIARYLKTTGKIPKNQSVSLSNLCDFFNLTCENENYHNAEYDIQMTIKLLKKFIEIDANVINL